jgi:hypothetical protein
MITARAFSPRLAFNLILVGRKAECARPTQRLQDSSAKLQVPSYDQ